MLQQWSVMVFGVEILWPVKLSPNQDNFLEFVLKEQVVHEGILGNIGSNVKLLKKTCLSFKFLVDYVQIAEFDWSPGRHFDLEDLKQPHLTMSRWVIGRSIYIALF